MGSDEMTEHMRQAMSLDGNSVNLAQFYNNWAGIYDQDVGSHNYGIPSMMVLAVEAAVDYDDATRSRFTDRSAVQILDAGCGTGLVGQALLDAGFTSLHGVDLSSDMVAVAHQRGIYQSLQGDFDLTILHPDRVLSADLVTVGGVFTVGHIPPQTLGVVTPMVKPGGILVVSTRKSYQDETDFVSVQQHLVDDGRLELIAHLPDAPYTMDSTGDYWAWRRPL